MTKEHKFSGTCTLDEIQFCLKCYDQVSEFPEGSGWSFTRCYFPQVSNNLEIPMEYFAYTVENVMKQGYSNELYWSTQDDWKNAIKDPGYIESEIYMALA